jgi:cell division protease FtsH
MYGRGLEDKEYSEKVGAEIDAEVKHIISTAEENARKVISHHRPLLNAIAERLIEVETIEREEFETILVAHGVQPKKKAVIEESPVPLGAHQ